MQRLHPSSSAAFSILSAVLLALAGIDSVRGQLLNYEWDTNSSGSWNSSGNWSGSSFWFPIPNNFTASATLGDVITANRTITIGGGGVSLNELNFDDNNAYTVQGGPITFGQGFLAPLPEINVTDSNGSALHQLNSNVGVTDSLTISQESSQRFTINGAISGSSSITKTGTGILRLGGSSGNTHSGAFVISGGTVELAKSSGNAISGSSVEINSGATLELAGNNQIGNATNMELDGGTFDANGFGDTLGTLTLSSSSTIDLGTTLNDLFFADSSSLSGSWSGLLTITGWQGVTRESGTLGQIFVGSDTAALTGSQLAMIQFSGYGVGAVLLSTGELVPIPETEVVLAALLLLAVIACRERRAIASLLLPRAVRVNRPYR